LLGGIETRNNGTWVGGERRNNGIIFRIINRLGWGKRDKADDRGVFAMAKLWQAAKGLMVNKLRTAGD
jgi:hypothetical protein